LQFEESYLIIFLFQFYFCVWIWWCYRYSNIILIDVWYAS